MNSVNTRRRTDRAEEQSKKVTAGSTEKMPKVYLAGPILYQQDYGHVWRDWLVETHDQSGLKWINPLDHTDSTEQPVEDWDINEIVEGDLELLSECDAMLVKWDAVPTAGTPMEIFFAARHLDIPVVVATDLEEGKVSPWITYHATTIRRGLEPAIRELKGIFQTV